MADLPLKLYNSAVVSVDSKIYVVGGWSDSPTDKVFIYNDEVSDWNHGPKLGVTRFIQTHRSLPNDGNNSDLKLQLFRYSPCAVVFGKKIIVTGGTTSLPNGQTTDLVT